VTITLYRFLTVMLSPFIHLYLLYRKKRRKEDSQRLRERFGYPSISRPREQLLWIHAASVGESLSVLPLLHRLAELYPTLHLLITTGTVTSAKMIAAKLPDNCYHQYIPVDVPSVVDRFLAYWKPDLALWVESELWPNLVTKAAGYCPLILLNARISERSFRFWKRHHLLSGTMLRCFSLFLPQSQRDARHLQELGAQAIGTIANLKYYSLPLPASDKELQLLTTQLAGRVVWVAASTHGDEEMQFGAIYQQLKQQFPQLITIIIPRHANRGHDITRQLSGLGLQVACRSLQEVITPATDVYVADTMGELGLFYRLASVVCLGGSFVAHGGQNPLEAARLGCAIISGPHYHNFTEIYHELVAADAAIIVPGKEALCELLQQLFEQPERQHVMAENALAAMESTKHILDDIVAQLTPFLEELINRNQSPATKFLQS
jgi:3-deoxy-D-manno-octulosonic-acid transferase